MKAALWMPASSGEPDWAALEDVHGRTWTDGYFEGYRAYARGDSTIYMRAFHPSIRRDKLSDWECGFLAGYAPALKVRP